LVWQAKNNPAGKVVLRRPKNWPLVYHYHFHIVDPQWGNLAIKMSGHPPFGLQISLMGMNGYSVRPKNNPSPGLRRATVLWAAPTWPALIGWLSSWTAPGAWRAWRKWWIAGSIRPACVLRSAGNNSNVLAFTTPIRATNWNTAAIFCSKAAGNWTRSIKGSLTARAECWTCPGSRLSSVANGVPEKPQHG